MANYFEFLFQWADAGLAIQESGVMPIDMAQLGQGFAEVIRLIDHLQWTVVDRNRVREMHWEVLAQDADR